MMLMINSLLCNKIGPCIYGYIYIYIYIYIQVGYSNVCINAVY